MKKAYDIITSYVRSYLHSVTGTVPQASESDGDDEHAHKLS